MKENKRLMKMFGIQAFGQLTIIIEKLLLPPLIISKYGLVGFGEWTLIRNVPMYFQMLDLGFFTILGNELTKNDIENRSDKEIIANSFLFVFFLFFILLMISFVLSFLDFELIFNVKDGDFFYYSMLIMFFYVGMYLLSQLQYSFLRGKIKHIEASLILQYSRVSEMILVILSIYLIEGFLFALFMMAFCRFVCVAFLYRRSAKLYNFNMLGLIGFLNVKALINDVKMGIGSSVFSFSQLFSTQWLILLLGIIGNTAMVGTFQIMKTVSSFIIQLGGVINRTVLPEFTIALNNSNYKYSKLIQMKSNVFMIVFSLFSCFILVFCGNDIFNLWLGRDFRYEIFTFTLIIISAGVYSCWFVKTTVLVSVSEHQDLVPYVIKNCVMFCILSFLLVERYYIFGAGLSLLIFEVINYIATTRVVNSFWGKNEE